MIAKWRDSANLRRLGICMGIALILAIMTGPQGRSGQPSYGIRQALAPSRIVTFFVVGLALWGIATVWRRYGDRIDDLFRPAKATSDAVFARPVVRYPTYVGLLIFILWFPNMFSEYWQGVLSQNIGVYVLLALGLNVVVGFAGLLDLGFIAFFAIGAYTTAYFTGTLPTAPPFTLNPFFIIPIATGAATLAGVVLGTPTLRLRGDYLAIVTLGFGEIILLLAINLDSITNGSRGAFGVATFSVHLGPIDYEWGLAPMPYWYLLVIAGTLIFILFTLLENSRVGRAWTAIREDEVAAAATGIPTVKYKVLAFAIGASTSGFAGVLFATQYGFVSPGTFAFSASILVLVVVIFGGMGSLIGSIVGAATIQWAIFFLRKHDIVQQEDIYMYLGALLIVMMIFRPQGMIPSRRRAREIGLAEKGIGGADAMGAPAGSPTT